MAGALPDSSRVQVNSTWDCEWSLETGKPKLAKISTFDYEEIQTQPGTAEPFSDATRAVFQEGLVLDEQLIHGRDHWYNQLEATIGVEGRGNGIAIADVNNDGLEDIYLCQPAALPNRLFLRNSDGTLRDVSEESRVDWIDSTRAALFVDLDNDGQAELFIASNNGPCYGFRQTKAHDSLTVAAVTGHGLPIGTRVLVRYAGGQQELHEVSAGTGYLSQSDTTLRISRPDQIEAIDIIWPSGNQETIESLEELRKTRQLRLQPQATLETAAS